MQKPEGAWPVQLLLTSTGTPSMGGVSCVATAARAVMVATCAALIAGCTVLGGQSGNQVENTLVVTPPSATPVNPDLATATPGADAQAATPQAFAPNAARVHFAPIVGAPVDKVGALSARLATTGPANNVRIEPSVGAGINHEIRGYFSALSENGTTTVIHVWDVFTPAGERVHRIQGQARVAGASANPWSSVPPSTMEQIADTVLNEYVAWRGQAT